MARRMCSGCRARIAEQSQGAGLCFGWRRDLQSPPLRGRCRQSRQRGVRSPPHILCQPFGCHTPLCPFRTSPPQGGRLAGVALSLYPSIPPHPRPCGGDEGVLWLASRIHPPLIHIQHLIPGRSSPPGFASFSSAVPHGFGWGAASAVIDFSNVTLTAPHFSNFNPHVWSSAHRYRPLFEPARWLCGSNPRPVRLSFMGPVWRSTVSAGSAIETLRRLPKPRTGPARHNALWCIRAGREDYGIGEMGGDEKVANCLIWIVPLAPISPLEGEMSAKPTEGGAQPTSRLMPAFRLSYPPLSLA